MRKGELEKYKIDQRVKLVVFSSSLLVAFLLALAQSAYTGEAFALLAGLLGGSALQNRNS